MKPIIAAVAATLLLAGCSNQQPQPATTPGNPGTATPTASATPASSASPTGLVGKVGDTHVGTRADVTLEQFNPKVTRSASDQTWQGALVKTCVKEDDVTVSTRPWQAIGADSGRYRALTETFGDAPKPAYPVDDESVLKGECVRGWVLFDAPANVELVEIRYSLRGEPPGRWMLTR